MSRKWTRLLEITTYRVSATLDGGNAVLHLGGGHPDPLGRELRQAALKIIREVSSNFQHQAALHAMFVNRLQDISKDVNPYFYD